MIRSTEGDEGRMEGWRPRRKGSKESSKEGMREERKEERKKA